MRRLLSALAGGAAAAAIVIAAPASIAQKPGGTLRIQHWDSPASMSIHEEATYSVVVPMMGVMNNLVVYDQHIPQNSMNTIRPDLAESWDWSEDGKNLTFKLRQGSSGMTANRLPRRMSNARST
jgi:peptide/nickel transport system substrate-binding protein